MSSRFEQILPAAAKPPQLITASDAKRELLERLLRGEANEHADVSQTILPRALDTKAQLSFAQERLWFLDQLMPDSPFFNVPLAVRLRRPVKLDALQRSVNEIIRRHEVLRTAFVTVDAEPSLIISPCLESKIKIIELGSLDATTAEAESRKLIHEEVQRPFDVSRAPLIRTTLIRLSATDSILLLTMHHIVSDGWSLLLFFKELAALYEGFLANRAPQVPALTIQYADYALWQKDWLRDEVVKPQLAYWKDQLGGDLPILDLPTDSARPVVQTYNGAREVLT
ncbi:MAG TPA: condensation domain-containing protein, partial [Pyrinomonadaceae bacterium]|nr:condensation domain-containing protein [Pyrinomonadaceae bacterium]